MGAYSLSSIITIVLQLIFLEGILSIDNAAVLGAMVAHLPDDEYIPWPKRLDIFHRSSFHLLGHQRQAALKVGLLGAYVGRAAMLFFATYIISNPWLRLIGAAYLFKLASDHFAALMTTPPANEEEEDELEVIIPKGKGFWSVVVAVELADLAFSLDNVVAAVALSDEFWVVVLGVALGILVMRFAAGIFSLVVEKEPILVHAAYLLILNIGIELIIEDFIHMNIHDMVKFSVSLATLLLVWLYGRWHFLHFVDPLLRVMGHFLCWVSVALDTLFFPFAWLGKQVTIGFQRRFAKFSVESVSAVPANDGECST